MRDRGGARNPEPWQRVLMVSDSSSGISVCAPPAEHPAINCDLSVVLDRDPVGDWIGMDARTTVVPGAGAMTQTIDFDQAGPAGLATQTLVALPPPRSPPGTPSGTTANRRCTWLQTNGPSTSGRGGAAWWVDGLLNQFNDAVLAGRGAIELGAHLSDIVAIRGGGTAAGRPSRSWPTSAMSLHL